MYRLIAAAGTYKVATSAVAVSLAVAAGVVHSVVDAGTAATVVDVIDGDTIDVSYDGGTHRVRLLNVDTPESVDPDEPVECLAPEATEWLQRRLPMGTEVRLEWDEERMDGYGRELAAVFVGDELVNAEIARAGLGVPMSIAPNTEYLAPVQAAHAQARALGRGLYSSEVECTLPVQVEQLETVVGQTVAETPTSSAALADYDSYAAELAALAASARSLIRVLDGDPGRFPLLSYDATSLGLYRAKVQGAQDHLTSATSRNSTARATRQRQLEAEETARRVAEEAARKAAEEAARKAAEEEAARRAAEEVARREADRAAAGAAARASQRSTSTNGGSSSRSSGSSATPHTTVPPPPPSDRSFDGPSGYTGCRSYAPGGRSWTPIPC